MENKLPIPGRPRNILPPGQGPNGKYTKADIPKLKEVLNEVIPKYENARIQMFVPIFIRRDTINQLKSMQALYLASAMTISGADEKNESRANSDPSARRIDRDEQDKAIGTALRHLKPAARGDLIETLF